MSKYTTEVRYICETAVGFTNSEGYNSVENIISKALPSVFNFTFPIFDESYRSVIETKILKHFYTREIGFETVGLWKLKLNTKINEIMPYYNKLYKSELLEFNPLYDVDLTRKHKIEGNGKKDSDATTTSNVSNSETNNGTNNKSNDNTIKSDGSGTNKTVGSSTDEQSKSSDFVEKYSDTPQGGLTGIQEDKYLTNATIRSNNDNVTDNASNNVDETTSNSITTNDKGAESEALHSERIGSVESNSNNIVTTMLTNTEDYLETVSGKQGANSYSKLLLEYRDTFLNIDMMVISELEELFMRLW